MNYVLFGAGALVAATGWLFFRLFRRLNAPDHGSPNLEWCSHFTIQRYRPMERLFSEADYRFLAAQPGYTPRMAKQLRAERRRAFGGYLRCLERDFDRLHTAARFLLLHSPQDRPDVVAALFRQRLAFRSAVLIVRGRLALQTLGIGAVDVRGLVEALEGMGSRLRQITAMPQPSLA